MLVTKRLVEAAQETKMENAKERLLIGTKEIQARTGWGRTHVQHLVRENILPNLGHEGKILVPIAALAKFINDACQIPSKAESSARVN
jgi:hypothetical protein